MASASQTCSQTTSKTKVYLTENDIPGARLPREKPEECNVVQSKRWLLCRGACTTGKKKQLIERIKNYKKSGLSEKELRDPDGGIHLAKKRAELGVIEEVEPELKTSFPQDGFSEKLVGLPTVTLRTIWTYMVACINAKKQFSTAKPMIKGYNFYKSGHVLNVKSCLKGTKAFVKCLVLPSMKKTTGYSCYIILTRLGFIFKAYSGCPSGIHGRCNHIAATLFALEVFCKTRAVMSDPACTSQLCKWNVPRKRKVDVIPISQTKFRKYECGTNKKERVPEIGEEVRAVHLRNVTNTKLYNIYHKIEMFQESTGKEIGFSHVLKQTCGKQLLDAIHHDHNYCVNEDDHVSEDEQINDNGNELLSPIKVQPISLSQLLIRCQKVTEAVKETSKDIERIESSNRNQSSNKNWHFHRKNRITASKAYRCASLKETTSPTKALKEILDYNKPVCTQFMREGLAQEPVITKEYIEHMNVEGKSVTVDQCGFFVSESHPFLGASPDGLVNCLGDKGLDKLEVNKNHAYFYQIQHQMFVTGRKWTDFVIKGSLLGPRFVKRVFFYDSFWKEVLVKLEHFFTSYMVPEIAYPRVKYGGTRLILHDRSN